MTHKERKKIRIGVITPPISDASFIPLSNLLNILSIDSQINYLITGNSCYNLLKNDPRFKIIGIDHKTKTNIFFRILNFFYLQIRFSILMIKIARKCDIWIFFLGGEVLSLPMIIVKLFRRNVFLMFTGSSVKTLYYDNLVVFIKFLNIVNCYLSDAIILYSENLIAEWNLEKWKNKILFAHEHYIDFQKFRIVKKHSERENLIGFIGRLSDEKGICNFILAIEIILKDRQDIKFLIVGDGSQRKKIEQFIDQKKLHNFVNISGWVSHKDLFHCYNNLKLIVIPSFTEGLPNVMLESMACGTPVLANAVGLIPNIIIDSETGYLLKNNSSQNIAENIIRALRDPNLEKIAMNAKIIVGKEFSFERTAIQWKKILGNKLSD